MSTKHPLWVEITGSLIAFCLVFVVANGIGWLLFGWYHPWEVAIWCAIGAFWPDDLKPAAVYHRLRSRIRERKARRIEQSELENL